MLRSRIPMTLGRVFLGVACLLLVQCGTALGQDAAADEKQIVEAIYAKTQSAKAAADFTAILQACEAAQAGNLSAKNRDYLKTLMAWSYSRRGDLRLQVSMDLQKIGNRSQAAESLRQAEADFTAALEHNRERWQALVGLAMVHVQRDELQPAVEILSKVCQLAPDQSAGFFNRAELLYQLGQYEQALADYDKVVTMNPGDVQGLTGRAHCHVYLGNRQAAMADYNVVCRLLPDNGMARVNRGDLYAELGDERMAMADYERAIRCGNDLARLRMANLKATSVDPAIHNLTEAEQLLQGLDSDEIDTLELLQCRLLIARSRGATDTITMLEGQIEKIKAERADRHAQRATPATLK